MSILLKNATYINWQSFEFTEADILIEEGINGKVDFFYPGEAELQGATVLDCSGKFVTKSLANGVADQCLSKGFVGGLKSFWVSNFNLVVPGIYGYEFYFL